MIKNLADLCDLLQLPQQALKLDEDSSFPLKVSNHFANQIEKGNSNDPLLRQILPLQIENTQTIGFQTDPVGDLNANPIPSLIHKYHGRALLIASPRCDIHCRYCFRRHFPYQQAKKHHWQQALEAIRQDSSLHEILLSGGDPLTLSQTQLIELIQALEAIPHVQTLRIHSRTPIVAPKAFSLLLEHLSQSRLQKVLVVHCNHAKELSEASQKTLDAFKAAGFHLLNQSVLLKGINDRAETLIELSHALFKQGVLPYYLHQLDKVAGAAHFLVENHQAWLIMEEMRAKLPGYLVPKLVQEIAGEPNKTPL